MNLNIPELLHRQLAVWETARTNYAALAHAETKEVEVNGIPYRVQYNPARTRSSTAAVDARSIQQRACFLCEAQLPDVQLRIPVEGHYFLLVNPYPIYNRENETYNFLKRNVHFSLFFTTSKQRHLITV